MTIKPFKLERFFTAHEFAVEHSLCSSDCEAMTIAEVLALEKDATEKFHNHWLGYTESKGSPALREDITAIYSSIKANDIIVCSGAQEPIFLFSQAMLKSGDEVVVQFPCYQSVHAVPESIGCKVVNWGVKYNNNQPVFDVEELATLVNHNTKAIYINSPHNPTGHHFTQEEQAAIIAIARKYNCLIFSDEVFRESEHSPEYKIPAMADMYENGISLGVLSKSYGLPGLRIGWIATKRKDIIEKISILKEYTTICNAAPSEFLAGVALRNRAAILKRNLRIIQDNISLLNIFFNTYAHLFSWKAPIAGPTSFVKMNFEYDDVAFAEKLIAEKKVLILPGEMYDYKGFFRIGFTRKDMPIALDKFEAFIKEFFLK
jgi:aspartate/methionine/tyrosine aminotransferase